MKAPLLITFTVLALAIGSVLAFMNNACKSSHRAWCAPTSDARHQERIGHRVSF